MQGVGAGALLAVLAVGAAAQEPSRDDFRALHERGESLLRAGQLEAALPHLEKARALDPAHAGNNFDLAYAYLHSGQPDKARPLIEAGVREHATAAWHHLLGELLDKTGDRLAANQAFQAAAHKQPSEEYLFDWGNSLLQLRAYVPAEEVFKASLQRFPRAARLKVGLGIAQYSRGQFAEAVETFCAAVDLDPKDERAYVFLGEMYGVSPERASEVARRLAALVEAHPDNALGRYHYAMSLWKGSPAAHAEVDLAEVQRQLERAVALDPDLALAHLKLGVLLSEKGRLEDAARELREAIRSKPDLADAHYRLGHLYLKMGRKAEAEKQLEEFRRLSER